MRDYQPSYEFASWAAFIAETRIETDMPEHTRASVLGGASWAGCTEEEANKYVEEGWVEGAEMARKFTAHLTNVIGALIERIEINYDVEGHNLDVARYLEGEPECWQRFEVEKIQQPAVRFIRIVVNGTASSGVDADTIMGRGACVAALVELLEFAGNRVEVVMAMSVTSDSPLTVLTVVKRFDEQLDMPKVAYAIAHPSVLRVHMFRFMESFDARTRDHMGVPGGYGRCAEVEKSKRGDIYLGQMQYGESQWESPAAAQRWVMNKLEAFGVTLKSEIAVER